MATTPDFSKIWGTNGDVTYKFTDDNYLSGWKFVGSVPPARGMFDAYFQGTDTKLKYLYDGLNAEIDKTYTLDDTVNPTSNTAKLLATLSELAHMIKTADGTSDWKTAPATNLATLATLVSNLASGSDVTWSGNKFTNTKLGITGLMEQNGYICFGKNFGGLILQWGYDAQPYSSTVVNSYTISFPLAMKNAYAVAIGSTGDDLTNVQNLNASSMSVRTLMSLNPSTDHRVKRPSYYIIVGVI